MNFNTQCVNNSYFYIFYSYNLKPNRTSMYIESEVSEIRLFCDPDIIKLSDGSFLLYGEYSEETELLRYFRDNVLCTTPEGQEIIRLIISGAL